MSGLLYPFLSGVPREVLEDLARWECEEVGIGLPEGLSREGLSAVLFARWGAGLLGSKRIRRSLLRTLDVEKLEGVRRALGVAPGKPFDVTNEIANLRWAFNSKTVVEVAKALDVDSRFLPQRSDSAPTVFFVEPSRSLPPLFDYQQELSEKISLCIAAGYRAAMLQLPTGAGKTRTCMSAVVRELVSLAGVGCGRSSVVWLAHSQELCEQALESFNRIWGRDGNRALTICRYWGSHRPSDVELMSSDVVFASYGKAHGLLLRQRALFGSLADKTHFLVVDEAHKALAPTVSQVIDVFKNSGVFVLGLTATPGRGSGDYSDSARLAKLFSSRLLSSSILGKNPIDLLRNRGVLSSIGRSVISSGYELRGEGALDEYRNDYSKRTLEALSDDGRRNSLIVEVVASEIKEGKDVLVFACTVRHARQLCLLTASRGLPVGFVDCTMSALQRRTSVEAFRDSRLKGLFNFGVLSTGFDAPNIETVVIARPTTSVVLYSQMLGRAFRGELVGGSKTVGVIDVVDNVRGYGAAEEVYSHFEEFWR